MNGVNVAPTAREFIAGVEDFQKRSMRRAIAMALNKTGDGARVDASREIRARYKVKVAAVNKAFSIQKATADNPTCWVRVRGRPMSLAGFSARQTRRGVTVNVKGVRKFIPHAFIRTLTTKRGDEYEVVFIREGKARLPVKALKTVDMPGLFSLKEINQIVRSLAHDRFDKELRAAMRAVLL